MKLDYSGRSQTVVFARFMQLYGIHLHRNNHAARANVDLHSYTSLYHLRNTMNQNWPFRKTLDDIEAWLIKQIDDFEGMMAHGANYALLNENVPPSMSTSASVSTSCVSFVATPISPRSRQDNPRNPFQEHRVVSITGATPQRGTQRGR